MYYITVKVVRNTFLSVDGIRQIHNLRIWGLTTNKTALAAHLAIEKGHNAQHVLSEATRKIRDRLKQIIILLNLTNFHFEICKFTFCKFLPKQLKMKKYKNKLYVLCVKYRKS